MFEDRQKRAGENREEITKRPHLGTQRAKSTAWRRLFDTRLRVSSEPAAVRRVLRTAAAATILKEEEWRVLLLPRLAYPPPPPPAPAAPGRRTTPLLRSFTSAAGGAPNHHTPRTPSHHTNPAGNMRELPATTTTYD